MRSPPSQARREREREREWTTLLLESRGNQWRGKILMTNQLINLDL